MCSLAVVAAGRRAALSALLPGLLLLGIGCSPDVGREAATSWPTASASPAAVEPALYKPNLVEAVRFDPVLDSACSRALGTDVEPDDEGVVVVYFSCGDEKWPPVIAAAPRAAPEGGDRPEAALERLFDGPTEAESEADYYSLFGSETEDLPFSFRRIEDVGVVDLSRGFRDVEFMFVALDDVAQIVSMVGRFEGIERVSILVDGEPLCRVIEDCA